jgi:hypothetical protein
LLSLPLETAENHDNTCFPANPSASAGLCGTGRKEGGTLSDGYLGLHLQILRERRGLADAALGTLLETRGAGVSAATYAEMERGRYLPDDDRTFLHVYASVLDLTEDELEVLVNLWAFAVLSQQLGEDWARKSLMHALISVQASA